MVFDPPAALAFGTAPKAALELERACSARDASSIYTCLYMYVCVYIYVYVYTYDFIDTHAYMYIYIEL